MLRSRNVTGQEYFKERRLMRAYQVFKKLVPTSTTSPCTQYLYSTGKVLIHGFTSGGYHVWERIDMVVDEGFVKRGPIPTKEATYTINGLPWIDGAETFAFDEIKAASLNRAAMEKHWNAPGILRIPMDHFKGALVHRLFTDAEYAVFRDRTTDYEFGKCSVEFPLTCQRITAAKNLTSVLEDDFECYTTNISHTVPTMMYSNGKVFVVVADYNTDGRYLLDGDKFAVKKQNNLYTISRKETNMMPKIKLPGNEVKAPEDIADEVVKATTEAPNWDVPTEKVSKNVKKEEEKVSENVKKEEEKMAENVAQASDKSQEEQLSLQDFAQALLTASETFEEELKTAFTNYKVLVKGLKTLTKRIQKELKNAADSKELKEALAENKSLKKANDALRQALLNGLNTESTKTK